MTQDLSSNPFTGGFGYPTTYAAKRKARRFAMQGLYEWLMTRNPSHEIEARTRADNHMHKTDIVYYHELLVQTIRQHDSLEAILLPALDRDMEALNVVEHAILLIGVYEMRDHLEIPYAVVIDEGVELAKHFGATDSHKYINGVLDRLARELRFDEYAAKKGLPPQADDGEE